MCKRTVSIISLPSPSIPALRLTSVSQVGRYRLIILSSIRIVMHTVQEKTNKDKNKDTDKDEDKDKK